MTTHKELEALNQAIAEKLFDWTPECDGEDGEYSGTTNRDWIDFHCWVCGAHVQIADMTARRHERGEPSGSATMPTGTIWVLEAMVQRGYHYTLQGGYAFVPSRVAFTLSGDGGFYEGTGGTLSEAVCRAALTALEAA